MADFNHKSWHNYVLGFNDSVWGRDLKDYLNGDNAKYDDGHKDQPVLTDNSVNND